jgi:hypothetical protein
MHEFKTPLNEDRQVLVEHRKTNVTILVNGQPVEFGSKPHVQNLETMLESLTSLRECYEQGTSTRTDLSRAISRVKRLLDKLQKALSAASGMEPASEPKVEL